LDHLKNNSANIYFVYFRFA